MAPLIAPLATPSLEGAGGPPAISVRGVHRVYGPRGNHVLALQDIDLDEVGVVSSCAWSARPGAARARC